MRKIFLQYFTVFINTGSLHSLFVKWIICLKWWATAAADLNLWYISSNSTFSSNVMTFFCFLGAPPESLVALRRSLIMQSLRYCTKHDEKYVRTLRDYFLFQCTVSWRDNCSRGDREPHLVFSAVLAALELHHDSNRRWLQNCHSSTISTTVDLCSFTLLNCKWFLVWSICVCKFW